MPVEHVLPDLVKETGNTKREVFEHSSLQVRARLEIPSVRPRNPNGARTFLQQIAPQIDFYVNIWSCGTRHNTFRKPVADSIRVMPYIERQAQSDIRPLAEFGAAGGSMVMAHLANREKLMRITVAALILFAVGLPARLTRQWRKPLVLAKAARYS
jgi:hypothetical protein